MIKVVLPENLYTVHTVFDAKGFIRKVYLSLNQDVADWLENRLGYVPEFITPIKRSIYLPTEDFVTEFKITWY